MMTEKNWENNGKIFEINDAHIIWVNLSGRALQYNEEGRRNFNVLLSKESYDALKDAGVNVRTRPSRDPEGEPQYLLKVNVGYDYRPPVVYIDNGVNERELSVSELGLIDDAAMDGSIAHVDISFRASRSRKRTDDYGLSAWLKSMYVRVNEDPIVRRHRERMDAASEDTPF